MTNNKNNNLAKDPNRRGRRGVGAIVGGVILAAILFTTVLIYFLNVVEIQKAKAGYDIHSTQNLQEKSVENLLAFRDHDLFTNSSSYIRTVMSNNGSLGLVVSYSLLYCTSGGACPPIGPLKPNISDPQENNSPVTLNPGDANIRLMGPVADGLTYRMDLITERGNVVASKECTVDLFNKICGNDASSTAPDFILSASPSIFAITAGTSDTSVITVIPVNGFSADVALSISPPSAGGITISPTSGTIPGGSGTMSVAITTTTTASGTHSFSVAGTGGGITHSELIVVSIVSITGAVNEGIVQGTGSLQLDFKAFGSIYPTTATTSSGGPDGGLASRADINQEGWLTKTYSKYGGITGYPAFDVMGGQKSVVYVERIRNLDPSGEDVTLSRASGLITNIGTIPNGHQVAEWICNATKIFSVTGDPTGGSIQSYDETTIPPRVTFIPSTPLNTAPTAGWREMYFCSGNIGGGVPNYHPLQQSDPGYKVNDVLNGNLMVARGTFAQSKTDYGQVIPYQSSTAGPTGSVDSFEACLRSSNTPTGPCPGPSIPCNGACATGATQLLLYSASRAAITGAGVNVWVHMDTNTPITVSWIYHDGRIRVMNMTNGSPAQNVVLVVNNYLPFAVKIPTDLDACNGTHPQYYSIKVNDAYNANGQRNVYYMTFQVTCT